MENIIEKMLQKANWLKAVSLSPHSGCHEEAELLLAAAQRIQELEAEIQEVSNQLNDLYELCSETTRPAVYGTILGLHERLEQALKGKKI